MPHMPFFLTLLPKCFQKDSLTADLEAPQLYILIAPSPIYEPDQNLQSSVVVFYSERQIQTAGSLEVVRVLQDNPGNTDHQDIASAKF